MTEGPAHLEPVADLCVTGEVRIHIDRTFTLERLPAALARVAQYALVRGAVRTPLLQAKWVGAGDLGESRLAARYLTKYVTKASGDATAAGLHRYEVAEGFQPRRVSLTGTSGASVLADASAVMSARARR